MHILEQIPGLPFAQQHHAFVPVNQDYEDFATNINLGWIIVDSVQTLAAVTLPSEAEGFMVSRAWLTDDQHNALPLMDIYRLSQSGAEATGFPEHTIVLVFGPVSSSSCNLRVEISRLEQDMPDLALLHPLVDPFCRIDEEQALHVMAWEEPDDPMQPVPPGTIAGIWAFEVNLPRNNQAWKLATKVTLNKTLPLGDNIWHLSTWHQGLTGCLLDSYVTSNPAAEPTEEADPSETGIPSEKELNEQLLGSPSPEHWLEYISQQGWLPSCPPPIMQLAMEDQGQSVEALAMFGPVGPRGTSFHHLFPPLADSQKTVLVKQVLQLPLASRWYYSFDPKTMDTEATKIDFSCPPLLDKCAISLAVEGLYWQEDYMLLRPKVEVDCLEQSPAVAVGDCLVYDIKGEPYECLGQTMVESGENQPAVYGWQFPPLHRLMRQACFEVQSINVVPDHRLAITLQPAEP